jgi:hypothetical protein
MRSRARLPYKLGFNNGPVTISHLNSHSGKRLAAKLIPHHIRKRAGRFLLRRQDVGQFHPLFIESDVIAVGDIEKVFLSSALNTAGRGAFLLAWLAWFAPLLLRLERGRAAALPRSA